MLFKIPFFNNDEDLADRKERAIMELEQRALAETSLRLRSVLRVPELSAFTVDVLSESQRVLEYILHSEVRKEPPSLEDVFFEFGMALMLSSAIRVRPSDQTLLSDAAKAAWAYWLSSTRVRTQTHCLLAAVKDPLLGFTTATNRDEFMTAFFSRFHDDQGAFEVVVAYPDERGAIEIGEKKRVVRVRVDSWNSRPGFFRNEFDYYNESVRRHLQSVRRDHASRREFASWGMGESYSQGELIWLR